MVEVGIDRRIENAGNFTVYGRDPVWIISVDELRNAYEIPFQLFTGDFNRIDQMIGFLRVFFDEYYAHEDVESDTGITGYERNQTINE
jgi:hypothetical protein